jgi:hypothetical protein
MPEGKSSIDRRGIMEHRSYFHIQKVCKKLLRSFYSWSDLASKLEELSHSQKIPKGLPPKTIEAVSSLQHTETPESWTEI